MWLCINVSIRIAVYALRPVESLSDLSDVLHTVASYWTLETTLPSSRMPVDNNLALNARQLLGNNETGICLGNRSDFCQSRKQDCVVGGSREGCYCKYGYGAQLVRPVRGCSATCFEYTCCPDRDGFECGEFSVSYWRGQFVLGVALFTLGLLGIALVSRRLARIHIVPAPLSSDDRAVDDPPVMGDGHWLHTHVPMEKWCVTLDDLRQLKRLVWHHVQMGQILPTELDPFDPSDASFGPSVHTVNSQLIAPITRAAGNMSWALMLHPAGLSCDLFITHGWAEGVYELIDKVSYSWPRGAANAYCCVLSNPQNLDISGLILSPRDSPFARALHSASRMLVVPNRACSIYARIWCAYEAFLAYLWQKSITTALSPILGLRLRLLRVCFIYTLGAGLQIAASAYVLATQSAPTIDMGKYGSSNFFEVIFVAAPLVLMGLNGTSIFFLRRCGYLESLRSAIVSGTMLLGWCGSFFIPVVIHGVWTCVFLLLLAILPVAAEADRLFKEQSVVQLEQLQNGFSGRLRDAQSTNSEDGERIRGEISAGDAEKLVDYAVDVLIKTGMSSPYLRQIAEQVGDLGNVSNWSVLSVVLHFVLYFALASVPITASSFKASSCSWGFLVMMCTSLVEGLIWAIVFCRLPPDRKSFAATSLNLIVFAYPALIIELSYQDEPLICSCEWTLAFAAIMIWPFVLTLTASGPKAILRVPVLGVPLVRAFMGSTPHGQQNQLGDFSTELSLRFANSESFRSLLSSESPSVCAHGQVSAALVGVADEEVDDAGTVTQCSEEDMLPSDNTVWSI